jgi:pimeloyl-ACP methyl ester carboxylesterase
MNVNGVSLKYLEQGQGTPVVFVHGSNSDHRIWEPEREVIAQRYRFIAVSQRYFGTDPWPDDGTKFSVATHADDLAAFIRELKAGPVNLVGWSYSGPVIFAVAVRHPELIRSLFLFEPSVGSIITNPADAKAIAQDRTEMTILARAATEAGDNAAAVRTFMDGVNAQPGAFDAFPTAVRTIMLDNARMLPLLFAAPAPPAITCAQLGQIKVPVAIVRGELTRPFYRIIAETANRCIPTSQLIIVPKARHLWPAQEPTAFNQVLLSFLKSN